MSVFFYILKLSVCLIIVWLFYQLVLRRLTFYTWNRWYLTVCTTLAFLLPLINIAPVLEKNNWTKTRFVSAIPRIPGYENINAVAIPEPTLYERLLSWLPYIIAVGAVAMLVRLLLQYFSLIAMRRASQLILSGPVKVYQVNKPVIPFSFGNAIYINQHLHEEEELKEIIRHEFIHVKQKHTIDIIWGETICILTWFNPFSWLLRKAIRQNLEFIADQQVLKTGLDRRQYQYLLLKVIGVPTYSIASNFNFKSLKKRIAMMNKGKTARLHLVRFLLLLPVIVIVLVAFRNATKHRQLPPAKALINDTTPAKKFPENVRSFHSVNNRVTVTLKDGTVETYNLDNEDEVKVFEKKYGRLPEPPTPPIAPAQVMDAPAAPHPHPYAAPLPGAAPVPDAPAVIHDQVWIDHVPAPSHHDQDCYNDKGYCLSLIQTKKGEMVLILHKTKKAPELVYLEDWEKDKKYEEKYGKLPLAPLPPTPPAVPTPDEQQLPGDVSSIHVKDFDAVVTKIDGIVERYNLRLTADKVAYESKYPSSSHPPVAKIHSLAATGLNTPVMEETFAMIEKIKANPGEVHGYKKGQPPVYDVAVADERETLGVLKNDMSSGDIEKLKTDLKAKGYTLIISELKQDNDKIVRISGNLNSVGHTSGFKAHDFEAIVFSREQKNKGLLVIEIKIKKNKEAQ